MDKATDKDKAMDKDKATGKATDRDILPVMVVQVVMVQTDMAAGSRSHRPLVHPRAPTLRTYAHSAALHDRGPKALTQSTTDLFESQAMELVQHRRHR